jgi:hypothetical protein
MKEDMVAGVADGRAKQRRLTQPLVGRPGVLADGWFPVPASLGTCHRVAQGGRGKLLAACLRRLRQGAKWGTASSTATRPRTISRSLPTLDTAGDLRPAWSSNALRRWPVVDLLLTDPVPQRLGVHPQTRRDDPDRRPLARVVAVVAEHQTNRLGPGLRVVLVRHETQPSKEGGVHQSPDGLPCQATFARSMMRRSRSS